MLMERHAYCERLSKLQGKEIKTPRVADWTLFYSYNFNETLKNKMKFEYIHSDGDVFKDYSWEIALSIRGDVYPEWTKLMKDKGIWFRLCGNEQVLTLPQFAVLLGLYEEDELKHPNRDPTRTNPRTSLIKEPLMRIVHRLLVGSLVHRIGSKERCQKRDLWLMSALDKSNGINLAWVIVDYLCKYDPEKCSEPIECEKWTSKMLASELDEDIHTLLQATRAAPEPKEAIRHIQERTGLNSSWGDWTTILNEIERMDVWRDLMLMRNNYMLEHFMLILHHLVDQSDFAYPTYEPPNVPP
nr:hypothetical protein [Tanacetum cinerariifolium]